MSAITTELPVYDRTARKAHQWTMVAVVVLGLVIQGATGSLLVAIAGAIMLVGRCGAPGGLAGS